MPRRRYVLPSEALCAIFTCLKDDTRSLAGCMRVNKVCFNETGRILWATCGGYHRSNRWADNMRLRYPDLIPLGHLHPDRFQTYAKFIETLAIGFYTNPMEFGRASAREMRILGEKSFHHILNGIEFPRLKGLELQGAAYSRAFDFLSMLYQYFCPTLTFLHVYRGYLKSDFLLLLKVCTRPHILTKQSLYLFRML